MGDRWGVFVNGDKWCECSDPQRAERIMDALSEFVVAGDPTASFDVMPVDEKPDA